MSLIGALNQLHPITNTFVVRPQQEPPPPNGFIFEFYNSTGDSNLVFTGMLENVMSTIGQIWTGQDAWQAMQFEVRINWSDTQWRWDFFPHGNMQYHNVYSTISGAGHRNWIPGVPSMQQEARGQPEKVNGLTWDEVHAHPGLLRDAMWHSMPVNFPFPHLQWREQDGHPGRGSGWRNDVWVWNFEYHCSCRWWDDIPCTCVLYPDFVCWLRGNDESRLSWWYRDQPIDDDLFLPSTQGWTWNPTGGSFGGGSWASNRTSGFKRLSLDHWHSPWERYPNLT
jgi:hypothetical protein